ncbi:Lipopolysaccharide-binding protein-like [Oopsacas minuta]|uniref:Lipopolysaccharide-binding protein-like n=1 Tax=Oopsacas minuta TaxID=111878 RepID=A0AAV7K365_9METZ|nr:Lipopolysaccharide-binding protein-like [Oopsacas minuta]
MDCKSLLAIATLICIISSGSADSPGARIEITQNGLNYMIEQALPYLKSTLNRINIPDISGKDECDYSLSNINIGDIELPDIQGVTGSGGLTLKGDGIGLSGGLDYSYKCPLWIHGSGNVDLDVTDASLSFTLLVDKDDTGHPVFNPNGCSLDISDIDIKFHGSLSWLANLFKGLIGDKIKSYANDNACSKLLELIQQKGNSFLQDFQTQKAIDDKIVIDYSLITNPIFSSTDLEVDIKGEFTSINPNAVKPPFSPSAIPQASESSKMAYLVASTYLANTAAFVINEEGYLQYNITPDTLPAKAEFLFTTLIFQDLIPAFYNKYPDMNLTLNMYATKPPILKVTPGEARLQGSGIIEFAVYDANCDNAIVHAFSLEVDGSTEVEVGLKQVAGATNVTGKIESLDLEVSILDTEVGTINSTKIKDLIDLIGTNLLVPLVNKYTGVGWPIPIIYGVELQNTEVTLGNDYIMISTDVDYEPQLSQQQKLEDDDSQPVMKRLTSRVQF